jgi:hypothetical protein
MMTSNNGQALGTAGDFRVFEDFSFEGPADYMAQYDQGKVIRSAKALMAAAPEPLTVHQGLALALQTDFAAYLGCLTLR